MQHPQSKYVIHRLARAHGHVNKIKMMAQEGRDCSELLMQISAVIQALHSVSKVIIEDHINHCVIEAAKVNDKQVVHDLIEAINQYVGITLAKDVSNKFIPHTEDN